MENKSEVLQVRLSPTLHKRLETQAALDGLRISELARFIIADFFSTRKPDMMPVEPTSIKSLKKELLKKRGRKCEICEKKVHLIKEPLAYAHHRHYRTKGHERPQDISILCKECHEALHERSKTRTLDGRDVPFVDPQWENDIMRARPVEPLIELCDWEELIIVLRQEPLEHIRAELDRVGTMVQPNAWQFNHYNAVRLFENKIEQMWQKHHVDLRRQEEQAARDVVENQEKNTCTTIGKAY